MSEKKPPKKKVVVTTKQQSKKKKTVATSNTSKSTKTKAKASGRRKDTRSSKSAARSEMIFSKQQLILMFAGFAFILIGLALMSGGAMEDPNQWDESVIYSSRRLTLAPLMILIGMGIEIYAIFKRN